MALQSIASIGTGVIIGLVYSWKLALFILAFMPFILVAAMLQMRITKGFTSKNNSALEGAGKVKNLLLQSKSNQLTSELLNVSDSFTLTIEMKYVVFFLIIHNNRRVVEQYV